MAASRRAYSRESRPSLLQPLQLLAWGAVLLAGAFLGPLAFARAGLIGFLGVYVGQLVAWGVGARLVWQRAPRAALWIILPVALTARVVLMLTPPFLSSDAYRYVWDGKLVVQGINPFRFVPAAPELDHLRDREIYPRINRPDSTHTPYPPVAQAAFAVAYVIGGDRLVGLRATLLVSETVTMLALFAVLRAYALNPARLILYAWCPLPLWEVSSSLHIDGLVVAAIALALLADARRSAARATLTGLSLAAAALTKLYPAALVPVFWRRGGIRMLTVFVLTCLIAFVPFLSVGRGIVGYLPWYLSEEGYGNGERFVFLGAIRLVWGSAPTDVYLALAVALVAWIAWRAMTQEGEGTALVGARGADLTASVLLLSSPHYPWHFLWLLPFLVLAPSAPWLYLVATGAALYLGGVAYQIPTRSFLMGAIVYGGAGAVWLGCWALRRKAVSQ